MESEVLVVGHRVDFLVEADLQEEDIQAVEDTPAPDTAVVDTTRTQATMVGVAVPVGLEWVWVVDYYLATRWGG